MNVLNVTSLLSAVGFTVMAAAMDIRSMRISNRLILAGLVMSLVLRIWEGGAAEILPFLWNITFPVILFYLFYLTGVLGAGDIKLFSMIGGFINFTMLWNCIVSAFLIGAVMSLFKMLFLGNPYVQLYDGYRYIISLFEGNRQRYPWYKENPGRLIHFSVPILFGLILTIQLQFLR